jgi:hypothetical protein
MASREIITRVIGRAEACFKAIEAGRQEGREERMSRGANAAGGRAAGGALAFACSVEATAETFPSEPIVFQPTVWTLDCARSPQETTRLTRRSASSVARRHRAGSIFTEIIPLQRNEGSADVQH